MASTSTSEANTTIKTRCVTSAQRNIELIGTTCHLITGAKLPSIRQVLQVFFHNVRFVKAAGENARAMALLTINAVKIFWQQARIPMQYESRCVDKLIKLYEHYREIQKTAPEKRSDAKKMVAQTFVNSLDDVFDIASNDALQTMRIEEDKQFLIMQRQKGRPGCMAGVDMALYEREMRSLKRIEKEQERKRKHEQMSQNSGT